MLRTIIRLYRRKGGVSLYIHSSLQYKLRNDFKINTDSETINSVFVEVDKNTTGTKRNRIVGCIYRSPWVNLSEYNSCMTNIFAVLQRYNKYVFFLATIMLIFLQLLKSIWRLKNLKIFYHLGISSLSLISPHVRANIPSPLLTTFIATFPTH